MSWIGAMYVVVGGAFGALCRYVCVELVRRLYVGEWPLATFMVNMAGSFLLGAWIAFVYYTLPERARELHLLVAVGALGGFTTFSTFAVEMFVLVEKGAWWWLTSYVAGSLLFSVLAVMAGMWCIRLVYS